MNLIRKFAKQLFDTLDFLLPSDPETSSNTAPTTPHVSSLTLGNDDMALSSSAANTPDTNSTAAVLSVTQSGVGIIHCDLKPVKLY